MDTIETREQVLHLLAEASEFEHSLLCCYLYAAFSLKDRGDAMNDVEAAAVKRWRKSIMAVSIEEMTHLALVANLTVSLGARPHFNRPNLPVPAGYHPAGIVIELAAFNLDTLDHFIFLERPADTDVSDGAGFDAAVHYERGARPGVGLMPAAEDYQTIAEFYERIRQALRALAARIGEKKLFIGPKAAQLGQDVMQLPGLTEITDLHSAIAALDTIVVQGEGAAADSADSHFARFHKIREEYRELLSRKKNFRPAWPCARNPVMRRVLSEQRVHISSSDAAALLDVANATYNEMLRLLAQAYGRVDVAAKRRLVSTAMHLMKLLRIMGERLASLPADGEGKVTAGVTFAMLRATEPLYEGVGEGSLISERLSELQQGIRSVGAGIPELAGTVLEWSKSTR